MFNVVRASENDANGTPYEGHFATSLEVACLKDADDVCKWGRRRWDIESSFHVDNMTQRKWVEVILQKLLARGIALALDKLPRRYVLHEFLTL